jgi:hypothetical protein
MWHDSDPVDHLRPDEQSAACLLSSRLGADEVLPRDVLGAPPATHDFDLRVQGRTLAVEVTMAADGATKSFWDAQQDHQWDEPTLSNSWGLTLIPGTRVKPVRSKAPRFLRILEEREVSRFDITRLSHRTDPDDAVVIKLLAELGVRAGSAHDHAPARIVIGVVGDVEWGGADGLAEVVESEAQANAEKLANAIADERHLFVWLDWTSHQGQAAVFSILKIGVPPRVPDLPPGVDTVWVAPTAMKEGGQEFLWRVTPPDPWDLTDGQE